ncbi:MAG: hypothetical protein Q9216_005441 [Gyalolechia sp. 2 TL-2023]
MAIEKLQFCLPAVFTIGPADNTESLCRYAKILTGKMANKTKEVTATSRNHVQDIVKGIIEGETRVIVSSMTMEEIFKEREVFKTGGDQNYPEGTGSIRSQDVSSVLLAFSTSVSFCLSAWVLKRLSYNANVKELQDTHGSEYFEFLSRKAHEGASNQA